MTNKTQLDRERLHAMERDAARITDEITDFENRLETEHAGEAELAQKQEQIRAQLAQADDLLDVYKRQKSVNMPVEEFARVGLLAQHPVDLGTRLSLIHI